MARLENWILTSAAIGYAVTVYAADLRALQSLAPWLQ